MIAAAGWGVAVAVLALLLGQRLAFAWRMELVARACHELRGSITAATLGLPLLARGSRSAPEALKAIELELAGAGAAIDDLSAARDGARGRWRQEAVDVPALLADLVAAFRPLAHARGVEVAAEWRGGPEVIRGDRARLAQAAGNLIANAIEHGEGPVALRGHRSDAGLEIAVTDAGPGLPEPACTIVRRARGGRRRRGHGLAIAADIAERHGGRLVAHGSTLALELPVVPRFDGGARPTVTTRWARATSWVLSQWRGARRGPDRGADEAGGRVRRRAIALRPPRRNGP